MDIKDFSKEQLLTRLQEIEYEESFLNSEEHQKVKEFFNKIKDTKYLIYSYSNFFYKNVKLIEIKSLGFDNTINIHFTGNIWEIVTNQGYSSVSFKNDTEDIFLISDTEFYRPILENTFYYIKKQFDSINLLINYTHNCFTF